MVINNSDMPQTTTIQTADGPVEAQLEPYATKMLRI
ncbi:MAG: 1,3-beta-galactosyl-N-acetylhexosamine phosphorylase C-terminal domain-containing protein [Eisenbergiella sp.]